MRVLGIDPGTVESGFIVWDDQNIECGVLANGLLLERIRHNDFGKIEACGIEMVESFGMPVGKETFETVYWIGRYYERAHVHWPTYRVYRKNIKLHLCGTTKAKDQNVNQSLRDKYGAKGTTKARGKTFGISGHAWSALAVADYVISMQEPTL